MSLWVIGGHSLGNPLFPPIVNESSSELRSLSKMRVSKLVSLLTWAVID